jgi:hypothetical protein
MEKITFSSTSPPEDVAEKKNGEDYISINVSSGRRCSEEGTKLKQDSYSK